jgi:hypothetical protein
MARMSLLCGGGVGAWGVLNLIETVTYILNISFSAQPEFLNAQRKKNHMTCLKIPNGVINQKMYIEGQTIVRQTIVRQTI